MKVEDGYMKTWNSTFPTLLPHGEAHARLGAVERLRQVLRKAVELYLFDRGLRILMGLDKPWPMSA